eukprot:UN03155
MAEVSIKVVGGFRPINKREKIEAKQLGLSDDDVNPFDVKMGSIVEVHADPENGRPENKHYPLDLVLVSVGQQEAFQKIALPTVQDCLRGINGTIFAYGQTGSGKHFLCLGMNCLTKK